MGTPLERAAASVFMILLGYALKRAGFFSKSDADTVAKLCLNITLPAAIITGFGSYKQDFSLFAVIALGAVCNAVVLGVSWFMSVRSTRRDKIFHMFALPGYQIGTFTLPYIGGALGPYGILVTCMFDMGNALFACGGTYALVSAMPPLGSEARPTMKEFVKRVFSTVPFVVYIVALVWVTFISGVPRCIVALAEPIGAANSFAAMFMIGLMIEIKTKGAELWTVFSTLAVRYAASAALALLFYFYTPFPLVTRQILALVVFSPVSALCPIFTEKCGGDTGMAGFAGSISIVISVIAMTACMAVMGI